MQLQEPEPEIDFSDRIQKYWENLIDLKGVMVDQSIPMFPWLSKLVSPCHMEMLMLSEDSPDLVAF